MQPRRVLVSEDSSQTFLEFQQWNVNANQTRRLQTRHFLLGRPGALRVPQLRIMVRRERAFRLVASETCSQGFGSSFQFFELC